METLLVSFMELSIYIYRQMKMDKKNIQRLMTTDAKTVIKANDQDKEVENRISEQPYWVGQSLEQLIEPLGKPNSIDSNVLKSSSKEVWKDKKQSDNRYSLRIVIENQCVVGFDHKY